MLAGIVTVITMAALPQPAQDTAARKDTAPPPPTAMPTIEQIRYLKGLKAATRGVAQIRDGLNRVARSQRADSLTRRRAARRLGGLRSEEHTSELQSLAYLVCRLLLEKKKKKNR